RETAPPPAVIGMSAQRIVPAVGRAGRATRAAARCRTYALRRIVAGIRRATLRCRADDCVDGHPCKAATGIRQADSARVYDSLVCVEGQSPAAGVGAGAFPGAGLG